MVGQMRIIGVTTVLRPLKSFLKAIRGAVERQIKRLKPLVPLSSDQWVKLDLLRTLVQREMEARYKGSILGNLWPLLNQLAQLLIYIYVFAIVLRVKVDLQEMPADRSLSFGLWLFAGLLPWLAFSGGLNQAAISVVGQPNLVRKVVFPLTLLPLVPICASFLESTFGLMTLIAFIAFIHQVIHSTLFLLPLVWLPQLLLTAGLGFLVAGITVFIRDVPQTLGVILNLWFYATPLIYPASLIPQPFQRWLFWLNPMAAVGEMYRDVVLRGEVTHWGEWGTATVISGLFFVVGYGVYRKLRPAFADVL